MARRHVLLDETGSPRNLVTRKGATWSFGLSFDASEETHHIRWQFAVAAATRDGAGAPSDGSDDAAEYVDESAWREAGVGLWSDPVKFEVAIPHRVRVFVTEKNDAMFDPNLCPIPEIHEVVVYPGALRLLAGPNVLAAGSRGHLPIQFAVHGLGAGVVLEDEALITLRAPDGREAHGSTNMLAPCPGHIDEPVLDDRGGREHRWVVYVDPATVRDLGPIAPEAISRTGVEIEISVHARPDSEEDGRVLVATYDGIRWFADERAGAVFHMTPACAGTRAVEHVVGAGSPRVTFTHPAWRGGDSGLRVRHRQAEALAEHVTVAGVRGAADVEAEDGSDDGSTSLRVRMSIKKKANGRGRDKDKDKDGAAASSPEFAPGSDWEASKRYLLTVGLGGAHRSAGGFVYYPLADRCTDPCRLEGRRCLVGAQRGTAEVDLFAATEFALESDAPIRSPDISCSQVRASVGRRPSVDAFGMAVADAVWEEPDGPATELVVASVFAAYGLDGTLAGLEVAAGPGRTTGDRLRLPVVLGDSLRATQVLTARVSGLGGTRCAAELAVTRDESASGLAFRVTA